MDRVAVNIAASVRLAEIHASVFQKPVTKPEDAPVINNSVFLFSLLSSVAYGTPRTDLQFGYYENAAGSPKKLYLKETESSNGFCFGGTGIKKKNKEGVEFIQVKCFNANNEGKLEILTLARSSLGYHKRLCVSFKDTGKTYTITSPLVFLASSVSNIGEQIDTASKEFAKIREAMSPFELTCAEDDVDIINPIADPTTPPTKET